MCQTIFRVGAVTSGAIEWRNKIPHDGSKHECTCGPYLPPILALEAACIGKANMGHLWSQQARFYGPPLPAHHSPMWGPHGYAGQVGGGSKMATGQDQSTWQINCWASVIYKYGTNITAALKSQFILNLKSLTVGCKACHKNPHCNVGSQGKHVCVALKVEEIGGRVSEPYNGVTLPSPLCNFHGGWVSSGFVFQTYWLSAARGHCDKTSAGVLHLQ